MSWLFSRKKQAVSLGSADLSTAGAPALVPTPPTKPRPKDSGRHSLVTAGDAVRSRAGTHSAAASRSETSALATGESYLSRGSRQKEDTSGGSGSTFSGVSNKMAEKAGKRRVQSLQGAPGLGLPRKKTGAASAFDMSEELTQALQFPDDAPKSSHSLRSTGGIEEESNLFELAPTSPRGMKGEGGVAGSAGETDARPASSQMRTSLLAKVLRPYTEGGSHLDLLDGQTEDQRSHEEAARTRPEVSNQQGGKVKASKNRRACTYDVGCGQKQKAVVDMLLDEENAAYNAARAATCQTKAVSGAGKRRQDAVFRSMKLKAMLSGDVDEPPDAIQIPADLQPAAESAYWKTLYEASKSMMEEDCPEAAVRSSDMDDFRLFESLPSPSLVV